MSLYLDLTLVGAQLLGLSSFAVYPWSTTWTGDPAWHLLLWRHLSIQPVRLVDLRNALIHQLLLPPSLFLLDFSHGLGTDINCQGYSCATRTDEAAVLSGRH